MDQIAWRNGGLSAGDTAFGCETYLLQEIIMSRSIVKIALGSLVLVSITSLSVPASARGHYNGGHYSNYNDHYYDSRQDYRESRYDRYERYDRDDRNYRNNRCDRGTGGTIIGAIAGGLLGHEVVGRRGDKTAGVIVGAGVGALAGRAIDRAGNRRC